MHLPSRDTIDLCIHILQKEHDKLIKAGYKGNSKNSDTDLVIQIKRAVDDLIRYDASIVLLRSFFQDLDGN